jgi:hypothetical protein
MHYSKRTVPDTAGHGWLYLQRIISHGDLGFHRNHQPPMILRTKQRRRRQIANPTPPPEPVSTGAQWDFLLTYHTTTTGACQFNKYR